ncbi:unnamed protein product [Paramecium pentaurelia]|uniref:Uncharacterized protein n=1 Tax=Paramecium pentaurelia TaxID=43138 RepID=A0A8S1VH58_9CILI|nr:unnamed protein product [Paramecium pentaurelia]
MSKMTQLKFLKYLSKIISRAFLEGQLNLIPYSIFEIIILLKMKQNNNKRILSITQKQISNQTQVLYCLQLIKNLQNHKKDQEEKVRKILDRPLIGELKINDQQQLFFNTEIVQFNIFVLGQFIYILQIGKIKRKIDVSLNNQQFFIFQDKKIQKILRLFKIILIELSNCTIQYQSNFQDELSMFKCIV